MKTLKDWAQELPKAFREALDLEKLEESKTIPGTIVSAITYMSIEEIIKTRGNSIPSDASWSALRTKYLSEPLKEHHIVYWFAEGDSRGLTVHAFDMYHALDIAEGKHGVLIDQVIYSHAKESVFKEKVLN